MPSRPCLEFQKELEIFKLFETAPYLAYPHFTNELMYVLGARRDIPGWQIRKMHAKWRCLRLRMENQDEVPRWPRPTDFRADEDDDPTNVVDHVARLLSTVVDIADEYL